MFSNTFAGIAPSSVPSFVAAQVVGAVVAVGVIRLLYPHLTSTEASEIMYPDRLTGPATAPGVERRSDMSDNPAHRWCCSSASTIPAGSLAARVLLDHYAAGRVRWSPPDPNRRPLNPSVVAVLEERGLDPSREFPKPLTDETARQADVIVTMGCGDTCPSIPASGTSTGTSSTRRAGGRRGPPIVDDIDRRVRALLAELVSA